MGRNKHHLHDWLPGGLLLRLHVYLKESHCHCFIGNFKCVTELRVWIECLRGELQYYALVFPVPHFRVKTGILQTKSLQLPVRLCQAGAGEGEPEAGGRKDRASLPVYLQTSRPSSCATSAFQTAAPILRELSLCSSDSPSELLFPHLTPFHFCSP